MMLPVRAVPLTLAALCAVLALVLAAVAPARSAAAEPCPNEARRAEQGSTFLPNCRAFELVTPPETEPYNVGNGHVTRGAQASDEGGKMAWFSWYPATGSLGGEFRNISTRGKTGWETQPIGPPLTPTNNGSAVCEPKEDFWFA